MSAVQPVPVARPSRRREATRERLVEAARSLLAESGIQGATVEQICERAGFTRGAFYSNYDTKDDLLLDVFRHEKDVTLGRLHDAMAEALGGQGPGTSDIDTMLGVLDAFVGSEAGDRTRFLVHQELVVHAIRQRQIAAVHQELWEQTRTEISAVVERGVAAVGRRLTVPVEQVTSIVVGVYEEAMRRAFVASPTERVDGAELRALLPTLLLSLSEPL